MNSIFRFLDVRCLIVLVIASSWTTLPLVAGPLTYFSERSIELDVEPHTSGAAPVQQYQLWYSMDDGKTWQPDTTAHQGPPPIRFDAPTDGEFGFRVVAIDRAGQQQSPPQPGDRPEFSCMIDTRPPRLDVYEPSPGRSLYAGTALALHWSASDENLPSRPVSIAYRRGADQPWQPVKLQDSYAKSDRLQWFTPYATGTLQIRIEVRDRSDNVTRWFMDGPLEIIPYDGFRGARGVAADPYSSFRRFPIFYATESFHELQLDTVEVWHRRGLSDWTRDTDPDRKSPYVFEADADGRHSIYVRMISLNGTADRKPPGPDSPPDMVVLVDTHSPDAELRIGSGDERLYQPAGEPLSIRWRAEDPNLIRSGAAIEISLDDGTTWSTLKDELDTSLGMGEFSWRPPLIDAESMRLRLVVRDLAGNIGQAVSSTRLFLVNPLSDSVSSARDHHTRAMALAERGDRSSLSAALERLELALNYNPKNAAVWHDRGVILTLLNDHEAALGNYEKAHETAPAELSFAFSLIQGHLNRHRAGPSSVDHIAQARSVFGSISKVKLYQDEDYRELMSTYRVLESALEE